MASDLKNKAVSGFFWSFADNFSMAFMAFVIGIILARLLSPEDYGLIGMTAIFISISKSFVDSGFSQALIRKQNCTSDDYSTVFYFNLLFGAVFFAIIYFSAHPISHFFSEPQLVPLIRVLALVIIFDSFSIIQQTILVKNINFKLLMKISVVVSLVSGAIAIVMAFNGFGVWSLVAAKICHSVVNSLLLWITNRWYPSLVFSIDSFKELYSFGSKLFASGLLDTIFNNIYFVIVGKYYSAIELGYYTKAKTFSNMPSENLSGVINRVSFPVLSSIQDDIAHLKSSYQKLIRSTMFISFILMLGMAAVAEPMVIGLIGEKWRPSVIYLQMLCFVGMFYPLHSLNLSMLKVQGRSDLFLKLEIIKKTLTIPTILIGIFWGIKPMIIGMAVNSLVALYLNSYWSGKKIGYSFLDQLKDIFPSFVFAVIVNFTVFSAGYFLKYDYFILLFIQLTIGIFLTIALSEIIKFRDYLYIKNILIEKFTNR